MRYLFFSFLVLFSLSLRAQHCGYCGAGVIVLHVHSSSDSTVIPGLRITLLDSTNLPVTFSGSPFEPFLQNSDRANFNARPLNHTPRNDDGGIFPFAHDNYILVVGVGMDLSGLSVLIQDTEPARLFKPYRQTVVSLKDASVYGLCGTSSDKYMNEREGDRVNVPVDIVLQQLYGELER